MLTGPHVEYAIGRGRLQPYGVPGEGFRDPQGTPPEGELSPLLNLPHCRPVGI